MFINMHSHVFTDKMLGAAGRWGPDIYFDERGYHHVKVGNWEMVQSTPETQRRVAEGWKVDPQELIQVQSNPLRRLAKMDQRGYDKVVVSLPLHFVLYWAEPEVNTAFARLVNDELAAYCAVAPDRLMFWAHVPLQDPAASAREAERAIGELGAKGILHGGANLGGLDADDERYFPLYEVMCKHDLPIFVHGYSQAEARGEMGEHDKYEITSAVGFAHDDTQMFYNIVAGGVLDVFPNLKIYMTHGGGYVPYHLGRIAACIASTADVKCKRPVREYMKNFWFDLELESRAMRRALVEDIGVSQIVYGDNFPGTDGIWEHDLVGDLGLSETDQAAILGGNAAKLLRL